MNLKGARRTGRRVWVWIAILTALVCLYPVEYQITRFAVVAGAATTWTGALLLWWQQRAGRGLLPGVADMGPGH